MLITVKFLSQSFQYKRAIPSPPHYYPPLIRDLRRQSPSDDSDIDLRYYPSQRRPQRNLITNQQTPGSELHQHDS